MPETAVNKYDGTVAGQNHIRFARKLLAMEPKSIAESMQQGANGDFGAVSRPLTWARKQDGPSSADAAGQGDLPL